VTEGTERLKPGQRRWVEEVLASGWDFSDKPYTPLDLALAMHLRGHVAAIFRMVHGRPATREELGSFRPSPQQAHDYLIRKLRARGAPARRESSRSTQGLPRAQAKEVEALLRRYLADFEAPTAADLAALRTLAHIEARLRTLWDRLAAEEDPARARHISDEAVRLSQELRQLQAALGIDRAARLRREREADPAELIRETLDQAREILEREVLRVEHCGTLLAWFWPAFPEAGYQLEVVCPVCGQGLRFSARLSSAAADSRASAEARTPPS
jgi:hypothetical protein